MAKNPPPRGINAFSGLNNLFIASHERTMCYRSFVRNGWKADIALSVDWIHPRLMSRIVLRAVTSSIFLLLATACERPTPKMSDEEMQRVRDEWPGMTEECLDRIRYGGVEAMPDQTDRCFQMQPAHRWRGLWRDDFEGSRFCPAPAGKCSHDTPGDSIWLRFTDAALERGPPTGRLYDMEFVGRRTARRGHHGHAGMSHHEIIVDWLISQRVVSE